MSKTHDKIVALEQKLNMLKLQEKQEKAKLLDSFVPEKEGSMFSLYNRKNYKCMDTFTLNELFDCISDKLYQTNNKFVIDYRNESGKLIYNEFTFDDLNSIDGRIKIADILINFDAWTITHADMAVVNKKEEIIYEVWIQTPFLNYYNDQIVNKNAPDDQTYLKVYNEGKTWRLF